MQLKSLVKITSHHKQPMIGKQGRITGMGEYITVDVSDDGTPTCISVKPSQLEIVEEALKIKYPKSQISEIILNLKRQKKEIEEDGSNINKENIIFLTEQITSLERNLKCYHLFNK